MLKITPIYISPKGGSITCFSNKNKRVFQSCNLRVCRYSENLRSAKKHLKDLEAGFFLLPQKVTKEPPQRKTTLKWTSDGELAAVDMARILDRLTKPELSQCDLACDIDDALSDKETKQTFQTDPLPVTAWLP
jgi:hypothetical protein